MIKTNNFKTVSKKILSGFLAVLMAFSCFIGLDFTASADSFKEWKINGTVHTRMQVNGVDAFCIRWGTNSTNGTYIATNKDAYDYWCNHLSSTKQEQIESIIAYANDKNYVNSSSDFVYFGVQCAIWHVTQGKSPASFNDGACKGDCWTVYNNCINYGLSYNQNSNKPEFKYAPLELKVKNNYVAKNKITNLTGDDKVDVTAWKVVSITPDSIASDYDFDLTVEWYDSDDNTIDATKNEGESDSKGLLVSSSEYFKGKTKITLESTHKYYTVTSSKVYKAGAQSIIVASGFSTKTKSFNVKCDEEPTAAIRIVKRDDDGSKIRSGVRYRIYTDKDDAIANNVHDSNGNLNDTVVRGIWTDEDGETHAYMETDETGRVTSNSVLTVGETYYIRECGYYDAATGEYIELTETTDSGDDAEVEVISNDDSAYVTNSYYRKTKAIKITSDDAGEVIRIGNAGDKIKDEDRSTDDYDANWVNIRKRGDLRIEKYDEHDNPVSGITFMLTDGADINLIGETNANGVLYFCNVPTGEYSLVEYSSDNYDVTADYPKASYSWVNGDGDTVEGSYTFEDSTDYYGSGTMQALITIEWDQQTSYDDAGKNSVSNVYSEIEDYYNGGHVVRLFVTNDLIERGDLMINKLKENGTAFEGGV